MIHIFGDIRIPEAEITFTASRSGGPGGQNVNKVSSRVTLAFDVPHSSALPEEQKKRIQEKLANRISKDGILQVVSQRTRSQELNRADAIEKFRNLIERALIPKQPRIRTRVPAGAHQQRLDKKKKRTEVKQFRSKRAWDD